MATSTNQPRTVSKGTSKLDPDSVPPELAANPSKKKSKLLLMLLVLLLLGAGGGAAWYFLRDSSPAKPKSAAEKAAAATAAAKVVAAKPPVYVTLEPFTVNLQQEDSSAQYLQVGLALKLADATFTDSIKQHMPEIRNRVLLLLSGKKASAISTPDGKKTLMAELAREIVQTLGVAAQENVLDGVLFTSFVIQ